MMKVLIATGAVVLAALIASRFVTIFVVQPIGSIPDGRTLVISRLQTLNFIDSADAWCEREVGNVNLLCRGAVLGRVAQEADIILRLPYSQALYSVSTGGKRYDR